MRARSMVVVSGGGTGIGRAVADQLLGSGTHVTVVGRRREPLESVPGAEVVAADLASPVGATMVIDRLHKADRICTGVVAAAGGLSPSSAGDSPLEAVRRDWQSSFESNMLTAVLLVEALQSQLEQAAGRVVLLSSVAALRGSGRGPYGAMKAALHAWTYDLARQLGEYGGTANVVAPGFVPDTEFWAGRLTDESRAQRAAQTLTGREGTPAEVASLIGWLLGPQGGWMIGQILSPNGGVVFGR
jgi:3-oxoacyl-[acyl-carrier protein] reductase